MKMGAEPRKVAILVVISGIAAYLLYSNLVSTPPGPATSAVEAHGTRPVPEDPSTTPPVAQPPAASSRPGGRRTTSQEFRPSFKRKGGVDPGLIDPKLRLDLLAKVQAVELAPAERNLFQFGPATPVVLPAEPKIIPKTQAQIQAEQARQNAEPTGPPPPPPITLKYYGYAAQRADGHKRAFFLDGDDIFVASEGDLIKKRFRVVRIGVNSVEVEDTQFSHTQMLPLAVESAG